MARQDSVKALVERLELPFNALGVDPYGISKSHLAWSGGALAWFYRNYFRVRCHGLEHIPRRGRAMLVGNHSGGIALDGAMVLMSLLLELDPPRLGQAMAEKFLARLPLASVWTSRTGQVTGLPEHALRLLEDDRLLVVFPEGVRGTAKLYRERHSLVDFGTGFIRLALKAGAPIIPVAVTGAADAVPTVANLYRIGRLLGVPYVPVTPWLLPIPLPASITIVYGAPMVFEGTGREDDDVIHRYAEAVKAQIASLIEDARSAARSAR